MTIAAEAAAPDSRALVASAKARLQDAAQLLLGGASTSEESHELL